MLKLKAEITFVTKKEYQQIEETVTVIDFMYHDGELIAICIDCNGNILDEKARRLKNVRIDAED